MTTAVILQSNYIPWRGYFDLIARADHFVFYDDVQFTKNDWRNRNRIVGPNGPQWLTIAVETSGKFGQTIAEARISDARWARKHLMALSTALSRGPQYKTLATKLSEWYAEIGDEIYLSAVNQFFIRKIMTELGLDTKIHHSSAMVTSGGQTGRLVAICEALGATRYLSGPAAKDYLEVPQFEDAGIAVDWMTYRDYPPYKQSNGAYDPRVSVFDALAWIPPDQVLGEKIQ